MQSMWCNLCFAFRAYAMWAATSKPFAHVSFCSWPLASLGRPKRAIVNSRANYYRNWVRTPPQLTLYFGSLPGKPTTKQKYHVSALRPLPVYISSIYANHSLYICMPTHMCLVVFSNWQSLHLDQEDETKQMSIWAYSVALHIPLSSARHAL